MPTVGRVVIRRRDDLEGVPEIVLVRLVQWRLRLVMLVNVMVGAGQDMYLLMELTELIDIPFFCSVQNFRLINGRKCIL